MFEHQEEHKCANCDAEFSIGFDTDSNPEIEYCPFCGSPLTEELDF